MSCGRIGDQGIVVLQRKPYIDNRPVRSQYLAVVGQSGKEGADIAYLPDIGQPGVALRLNVVQEGVG
ncbi:MAG: hypothetical protein DDT34_02333 [Firmicutes bacterium]|nr:hypothetical protein [Bacillota bacterium]